MSTPQRRPKKDSLHTPRCSLVVQSQLIDTFAKFDVPKFYQNLFISYLKKIPKNDAQLYMKQQIKSMLTGQTYIQSYLRTKNQKEKVQRYLRQLLAQEQFITERKVDLGRLCEYVKRIRNLNFKAAHYLSRIRDKYEENVKINCSTQRQYFSAFASNLDALRPSLQQSQISCYLQWQQQYDPFFMHVAVKDNPNVSSPQKSQNQQLVTQMLDFSVEESFKLLKMKKLLIGWMYLDDNKELVYAKRSLLPQIKNKGFEGFHEGGQQEQMKRTRYNKQGFYHTPGRKRYSNQLKPSCSRHHQHLLGVIKRSQISRNISANLHPAEQFSTPSRSQKYHYKSSINSPKTDAVSKQRIKSLPNQGQDFAVHQAFQLVQHPKLPTEEKETHRRKLESKNLINIEFIPIVCNTNNSRILVPMEESRVLREKSQQAQREVQEKKMNRLKEEIIKQIKQEKIFVSQSQKGQKSSSQSQTQIRTSQVPEESKKRIQAKRDMADAVRAASDEQKEKQEDRRVEPIHSRSVSQVQERPTQRRPVSKKKQLETIPQAKEESQTFSPKKTQRIEQSHQRIKQSNNGSNAQQPTPETRRQKIGSRKRQKKPQLQPPRQNEQTKVQKEPYLEKKKEEKIKEEVKPVQTAVVKPTQSQSKERQSQQRAEQSPQPKSPTKRDIKMKIQRFDLEDFKSYLSTYKFNADYSKNFDISLVLRQTQMQQTYVIQFLVNGLPCIIALNSLTQNNNLVIRFWALSEHCQTTIAAALFKKYVEIVEKSVTNQTIYYRGHLYNEIEKAGFVPFKKGIFMKKKNVIVKSKDQEYPQFFGAVFSIISFSQSAKEDLLASKQTERFNLANTKVADFLFTFDSQKVPSQLQKIVKISNSVSSLAAVNKILEKENYVPYDAPQGKQSIQKINLARFSCDTELKNLFVVSGGLFKLFGNVVVSNDTKNICSIRLKANNGRVFFAKGYKSAEEVSKDLTDDTPTKRQFVVPMFSKQLLGRFPRQLNSSQAFYGNWQVSLFFQDEMQGPIQHDFKQVGLSFKDGVFFVGVELQGTVMCIFSVNKNDHIG